MGALTNGLVQMNAKMVLSGNAKTWITLGIMLAVVTLFIVVTAWLAGKRFWWVGLVVAAAFVAMAIVGYRQPRLKEIRACAVEPVELDRIAAVYDIVSVDGKELVLRERG